MLSFLRAETQAAQDPDTQHSPDHQVPSPTTCIFSTPALGRRLPPVYKDTSPRSHPSPHPYNPVLDGS
jgi:hypothetical protein